MRFTARRKNDNLIEGDIPELVGQTCTFAANKIIKGLPDYDRNGFIKELLLENLGNQSGRDVYAGGNGHRRSD